MDINEIISQMTLEEKAGLCSGVNSWETKPVEKLGVTSIMMCDGPHGLRKIASGFGDPNLKSNPATCFPPAVLSACSFDRELIGEIGAAIGDECVFENVSVLLGPGVNIKRSPLCGRNFEYPSEDPYLSGEFAKAFIDGVQSKGVGTCIKHFAANEQETRRFSSDSRVDERTLHEIYFPPFKKVVEEAQPTMIMSSYNKLNGDYTSESQYLLTEILRDRWAFDGVAVSDWGAVNHRIKGLVAGLDLEMPGSAEPLNDKFIIEAVRSGALPESTLDIAVERILKLIERVGNKKKESAPFDADKHNSLALRVATESMVLLKNDKGLLPLNEKAKIVFIGEFAKTPRYQGAGSSDVNPLSITCALDAVMKYTNVSYCKGYDTNNCDEPDAVLQAEAVSAAKVADVCVLFVGLPPAYESEGFDRKHMHLPQGQNSLIEAVAKENPNVVVVLHNGSPIEMPWIDSVGSLLEAYLGGQACGGAIIDILFGKANPCGKLAESFPLKLSDNPSYLFYFGERDLAEYREGVFVGYRYYDAKKMDVLFPFGHGLSYTSYEYSNLRLSKTEIDDTETVTIQVDVTNIGTIAGKEIVQLYVGQKEKDDRLIRADKELKEFAKVSLGAGETKTVVFTLDKYAFAYYNTEISDWHVLSAEYEIILGRSSRDIAATAEIVVNSTVQIPFRADVNTTIRDIRRMERSEPFLKWLAETVPFCAKINDDPEPYVPEMVLRQLWLMGMMTEKSLDEVQKTIDEKLN